MQIFVNVIRKCAKYVDKNYGLIMSGNLDMAQNAEFKSQMRFGKKYKVKQIFTKSTFVRRFNNNIEKLTYKKRLCGQLFQE